MNNKSRKGVRNVYCRDYPDPTDQEETNFVE